MRSRAGAGLLVVVLGLSVTVMLGLVEKSPCASGNWGDLRQYRQLCYSDIVPLYGTESLQGNRLPYIDECTPSVNGVCDEYPVLTMYAMRIAAWPVSTTAGFFYANVVLLIAAAFATAYALWRLAGRRALFFALAPTLLIYGFVNWDLIAVAFAATATYAFVKRRNTLAGVLLGLGAAAKFFPALLVVPFVAERLRKKDRAGAIDVFWWSVVAWLAADLPFMILAPRPWSGFFRFNAHRVTDFDSLWYIVCNHLHRGPCGNTGLVNKVSLLAFLAAAGLVWMLKVRRHPDTPRWHLGFPILVVFLLSNKVYSPQYSLWLLPWFALALPDLRWFLAFEAADVAVFVTRFAWFGSFSGPRNGWTGDVTYTSFEVALLVRAAVLVGCLIAFLLRAPPRQAEEQTAMRPEAEAMAA